VCVGWGTLYRVSLSSSWSLTAAIAAPCLSLSPSMSSTSSLDPARTPRGVKKDANSSSTPRPLTPAMVRAVASATWTGSDASAVRW
jgi:hypothetical protein